MHEELLGVLHHLGVFLEKLAAEADFAAEPWVGLVDLPVEDERVDDAESELDGHPEVVAPSVPRRGRLDERLDDGGRLVVGGDDVVLLVGAEERLAVVNEIADER